MVVVLQSVVSPRAAESRTLTWRCCAADDEDEDEGKDGGGGVVRVLLDRVVGVEREGSDVEVYLFDTHAPIRLPLTSFPFQVRLPLGERRAASLSSPSQHHRHRHHHHHHQQLHHHHHHVLRAMRCALGCARAVCGDRASTTRAQVRRMVRQDFMELLDDASKLLGLT